jgi:hypothetical protein
MSGVAESKVEMTRRLQIEPSVAELYARHRETVKPWVDAVPSTHVFVADLPDDLEPGTWTVTVRAVDEFGRVHHGHRLLEPTEGSQAAGTGPDWPPLPDATRP